MSHTLMAVVETMRKLNFLTLFRGRSVSDSKTSSDVLSKYVPFKSLPKPAMHSMVDYVGTALCKSIIKVM